MNAIAVGLAVIVTASLLGVAAGALLPQSRRAGAVGTLTAVAASGGVLVGLAALTGRTTSVTIGHVLPLSNLELSVDALSGVFVLLTGGVGVAAGIYAIGYTGSAGHPTTTDARPGDDGSAGTSSRTSQAARSRSVPA